jgi:sugar lactone lactonase YvrE
VWAALGGRTADGICLDADGQIWVANPFGPEVFRVAEGGEVTASITTTQNCYACMLGGGDGRTLFCLTAQTAVEGEAESSRSGRLEVATVDVPRSGRP